MEDIDKVLSLMNRMRLFPETDGYKLTNKIIVENKKEDLLEEGVHQSYEAKEMLKILLKYYNIGNEENFIENGNEIGVYFDGSYNSEGFRYNNEIVVFILVIPKSFKDFEKIKKFFENCGWILAQQKLYYKDDNMLEK